jgi:hypothetical protein
MERAKLINKILLQWAEVEAHKTTVLVRAARDNPLLSESNGSTSGWGDLN